MIDVKDGITKEISRRIVTAWRTCNKYKKQEIMVL